METPSATTLKARYVFPVEAPPIADGTVTILGNKIVSVGRADNRSGVIDLGNVAILPGLVNAHTHLEFSDLEQPLGRPRMAFSEWISLVVAHRRLSGPSADAVPRGLAESWRLGTTLLGEIAQPAWCAGPFQAVPLRVTVFLELLDLLSDGVEQQIELARRHVDQSAREASYQVGLAPHAPYTVHPELFSRAVRLATERRLPLAFHLAESREEIELLRSASGGLVQVLVERGKWREGVIPIGTRPIDYLRTLSAASRSLVVHGNYLDDDEINLLAGHAESMSVIYCPRTHAFFGHDAHPLPRLLAAGANVALGTDSRASNPDLSILEEMRFVARHVQGVAPSVILELGTLRGARALGLEDRTGSLRARKDADLTIVALGDDDRTDPHESLFDSNLPVVATYCRSQANQFGSRPSPG